MVQFLGVCTIWNYSLSTLDKSLTLIDHHCGHGCRRPFQLYFKIYRRREKSCYKTNWSCSPLPPFQKGKNMLWSPLKYLNPFKAYRDVPVLSYYPVYAVSCVMLIVRGDIPTIHQVLRRTVPVPAVLQGEA